MLFARLHSVYWSLIIYIAFNLILFINNDQEELVFSTGTETLRITYYLLSFYIFLFLILMNFSFYLFKNIYDGLKWYHYLSSVFITLLVVLTFLMFFFWGIVESNYVVPNGSGGHLFLAMEFLFLSLSLLSLANFTDVIRWMKEKM